MKQFDYNNELREITSLTTDDEIEIITDRIVRNASIAGKRLNREDVYNDVYNQRVDCQDEVSNDY